MRSRLRVGVLTHIAAALVLCAAPTAHAAFVTGNIEGVVTDEATGKPLGGVTVSVTGPSLQGEQTEFTDSSGHYLVTELPAGSNYMVRFYFSNITVERGNITLRADQTLSVSVKMPAAQAQTQKYIIKEKAPSVDVGNAQVQTQVTNDLVRNLAVGNGGRTYGDVLALAPGAAFDDVGASFGGATGPENNFLIEGLNTTDPAFGTAGTALSLEFIQETEIITGGYNAEYGRATGGVVDVITKSGSNEFHGGAFLYYQPYQLDPKRSGRPGEAFASVDKLANGNGAFDFGFDLGGPIVKDRVWFYVGFNPQVTNDYSKRIIQQRIADTEAEARAGGRINTDASCPAWLADKNLCPPAGGFLTTDLPDQYNREYTSTSVLYNWIAKLNAQITENQQVSLEWLGSPSTFDGVSGGFAGSPGGTYMGMPVPNSYQASTTDNTHDVLLHYIGKFLDRKLQVDVLAGYHYDRREVTPVDPTPSNSDLRDASLITYEPWVTPCQARPVGNTTFDPCPLTGYSDGGYGFLGATTVSRLHATAGVTYFAKFFGTHALKVGGDFEDNTYEDFRQYGVFPGRHPGVDCDLPGKPDCGGSYTTYSDGTVQQQQYATVDPRTGKVSLLPNGLDVTTQTFNESFYLRDSYNVSFIRGLTINAGLRWELQQVKDINGDTQISITDNIAPRIGIVYDFTGKGYSKLYASYGRFYESIPLDINDREFSGEGFAIRQESQAGQNCTSNGGRVDIGTCSFGPARRSELNGGTFGKVAPNLQGQYSNEIVAGLQYDVGYDIVLGASYIHRDLGRIVEDVSPDGGATYLVGNPGSPTDPGAVASLQSDINDLNRQIAAAQASHDTLQLQELRSAKTGKTQTLALYEALSKFDKPVRDYNAFNITANKRLSHNFNLLASYTYSRTLGNYPGLYQSSNGQLDPNISTQYDLIELLANRYGPLPNDRPHNFKFNGSYSYPMHDSSVTAGVSFNAISGQPIEVLGAHPTYGQNEVFILQRGSGGRTPTLTSVDLHLGYMRVLPRQMMLEATADVFNLFNEQGVTAVDESYTYDQVLPITNGTYDDLSHLKTVQGRAVSRNENYGKAVAYQAPLALKFGVRISF